MRCALQCALAAALIVLSPGSARAQVLTGVVRGPDGPVAGASVAIAGLSRTAVTDADGSFRIGPLPAGPHRIEVEHIAFATKHVDVHAALDERLVVELTPRPLALSSLVVTASRRTQQLKDVPVATEIIDRAELRRSGASDLSAVLTERTGVSLQGGHPVGAGVMLQGLGSERVLVLVDGQPLQGRIAGTLDLARTPVAMVDRVEVVKGPQSTLYGSDAMGGVINIITRAPDGDAYRAGVMVTGGSRSRMDIAANAGAGAGPLAWTMEGGRRSIDLVPGHAGDAATTAERLDGAARVEWQRDSAFALHAGMTLLDEAQRWRTGALYSFADNRQWTARVGSRVQLGTHTFTPTLYATGFDHLSRRSTLPRAVDGSGERESQRLVEAELLYAGALRGVAVDAGVEARRETIDSDRVSGRTRALYAVEPFVQTTFGGERWSIVPGVRHSWSEQWGSHLTPRVAAMFRPVPSLALRASAGQGFRAPSFKELYMEFLNTGAGDGYRVRGNASLRPETSRNVSGSVEWAGQRVYVRGQAFHNRFDDFIETVELADSSGLRVFTYDNIDDGATYGAELELGATWRGLRAEAGHAWVVAQDRSTGERLAGRPEHSLRAALTYAHARGLRATLSGTHTGRTLVGTSDTTRLHRAPFSRLDARIAQALPWGLELGFGVDNITGARPDHWPGFITRQFHMSLGWSAERTRR